MTSVVNPLPIPKPKRFAPREKSPFLPLAFSSSSYSSTPSSSSIVWRHFTGYLVGEWVVVFHRGDAEMLSKANFGKGALSKFGMTFDTRDWKAVSTLEPEFQEGTIVDEPSGDPQSIVDAWDEPMGDQEESSPPPPIPIHPPPSSWPNPESRHEMKFQISRRRFEKHERWRRDVLGGDAERMEDEGEKLSARDEEEEARDDDHFSKSDYGEDEEEPREKRARFDDEFTVYDDVVGEGKSSAGFADRSLPSKVEDFSRYSFGDFSGPGDFLIYEDTDSEEEEEEGGEEDDGRAGVRKRQRRFLFSRYEDPLPLNECLLLSHEEAFFLSYGLGCLTVMSSFPLDSISSNQLCVPSSASSSSSTPLPLLDLWRRFRSSDSRFPSKYVAYHFYRSRGWVPRCGLKFGVDFLLYVYGPRDYHATFSLVVEEVDHKLRSICPSRVSSSVTSASALSRVTEQVNKDSLFCYVVRPKTRSAKTDSAKDKSAKTYYSSEEFEALVDSPNCVKEYRVKEVLKKRWIMDTERDQMKGLLLSMK